MNLFYGRINWEDYPSINTAVNALNLNKIDYAAKLLDERTCELYNTKAEQSTVLNTINDWTLDESTGIITITKVNGEQILFDLNIEKIPVSFSLSEDGILTMTTDDGSVFTANIGAMIPVIAFESSDTISFTSEKKKEISSNHTFDEPYTGTLYITTVKNDVVLGTTVTLTPASEDGSIVMAESQTYYSSGGVIKIPVENVESIEVVGFFELIEVLDTNATRTVYKASVKDGSIKDKHLEPNYLANITTQAENAELSATASAESATASAESAEEAKGYAEQAKESAEGLEIPVPVANLAATVEGKPLDATMGKELNDRLAATESCLADGKVKFQVTEDGKLQYSVYTEDA